MKTTRKVLIYIVLTLVLLSISSCNLPFGSTGDSHDGAGHTFVGGVCSCGEVDPNYVPPCSHNYENGVCESCGEICAHDFSDFVSLGNASCTADGTKQRSCKICGLIDNATDESTATGHSFTNYITDNNATCTVDGTKTAKCDNCDETDTVTDTGSASHSFTSYVSDNNATCTVDGTKTAKCDNCDETDTVTDTGSASHSFTSYVSDNNATCTADGTKTAKCDKCDETDTITDIGTAKSHSFTQYIPDNNATCQGDGTKTAKCDNCDETDTVTDAGTIKPHNFSVILGYSCDMCGLHGEEITVFSPIINKLSELARIKSAGDLPKMPANAPDYVELLYYVFDCADAMFDDDEDPNKNLGYAVKDLDGNGELELIILGKAGFAYAVYTTENNAYKLIYKAEECNEFKKSIITEDDSIYYLARGNDVSGNQVSLKYSINEIVDGSLFTFEFGWRMDGENQVYYKSENGAETVIDNAEYKKFVSIYDCYITTPSTSAKKANLIFVPAVKSDIPENRHVFDMTSSYDAIIATYKAIYDAVLTNAGRFRKADWQEGRYNDYLVLETYDDYALYNRLLGAICCVQKDSSKTQYGYLLKDFDGNGVEELVLLDMYVASAGQVDIFAIFTLVEGKPVLVDCYGDTRFASIDASGKVTVAERRLFSHTKDMTLSVCTVSGDKLIASQVYSVSGTDYTSTTAGLKYTLTENGETAEIDKTAYDEFLKTIANGATTANFANFGKQNYKNSGLNELFAAFNK